MKRFVNESTAFLLLLSFFEGGAVMAVELMGAKLIAPYYGGSLYVWAAILALTLGGLAAGYFLGGRLSLRTPRRSMPLVIIAVSALWVGALPVLAPVVLEATLGMGLRQGIVASGLILVFPPLLLFGMVSPLIVRLISRTEGRTGHAAGVVYTVSTLGGILVTFLAAFLFIPHVGLAATAYVTAALLGSFPVAAFAARKAA